MDFLDGFKPNPKVSAATNRIYWTALLILLVLAWMVLPSKIIPMPWTILAAFPDLWYEQGFGQALWTSLSLFGQAVGISILISLAVAYATVLPAMRPLASTISLARFNGFVGLPLLLTLILGNAHMIKIALLVIGMSAFMVPSVVSIVEAIPSESYDLARVMRYREWRVVYEVVVLGQIHLVLDTLRTNMAMGFMMLPMVEGLYRADGGIGALLLTEAKYFHLDAVYFMFFFQASMGFLMDFMVRTFRRIACPYADKTTENK